MTTRLRMQIIIHRIEGGIDLEKKNNVHDIKTNNKLEEQDRNKELASISSNPKEEKTGN